MGISRLRKNRKKLQLPGSNRHGVVKPSKKDFANIQAAYNNKCEEYELLSLDELEELQETSKLSHTYKMALKQVIAKKKIEVTREAESDSVEVNDEVENSTVE